MVYQSDNHQKSYLFTTVDRSAEESYLNRSPKLAQVWTVVHDWLKTGKLNLEFDTSACPLVSGKLSVSQSIRAVRSPRLLLQPHYAG